MDSDAELAIIRSIVKPRNMAQEGVVHVAKLNQQQLIVCFIK
jgi:hypothetical protein